MISLDPTIRVRAAGPADADRISALVRSLSSSTLVDRFMGGVSPEIATAELRREVEGHDSELAFIAENTDGRIVGEGYAALLSPLDAEAAFVVADPFQHRGVGTALMAAIIGALRSRGVRELHADTRPGNIPMLALLHEAGFPYAERYLNGAIHATVHIGEKR